MKYGLDIKTPTTDPKKDGWEPVMENELARKKFEDVDALFAYYDRLKQTNGQLELRVVEIQDHDPSYSV